MSRRAIVLAAAVFLVGVASLPSPAAAGTAYRYWSYWHWKAGAWEYSRIGPAGSTAADGSVEGWHFGVQVDAAGGTPPSIAGDFQTICGDVPSQKGKRVAVVLDYGTDEGAPARRTACADVPVTYKGIDVLAAVAGNIRMDKGLICAIDGYPKPPECGSLVRPSATSAPAPSATAQPTPGPASTGSIRPASPAPAGTPPPAAPSAAPTAPQTAPPNAPPTAQRAVATTPTPVATPSPATSGSSDVSAGTSSRAGESRRSSPGGLPIPTLAGAVLVVVLAGSAAWRARGRRRTR
jgi:hypothetical protein